ncbi:MAG: hypothetical protein J7513_17825 [Solirubrobacteraceae bacterium]|nr:hypothetical protein [Solirubrobacteraceae bacterium]
MSGVPGSPRFVEPRGYALVSFISTAMIVAGIGLAWTGLLLAGAGAVLSVIEFKELRRLNPWLMPEGVGAGEAPLLAAQPMRIARVSTVVTVLSCAVALGAVQVTGDQPAAIPPAAIAGLATLAFNAQMRRALG